MNRRYEYNNAASLLADKNNFSRIDIIKFGRTINEMEYRKTISNISILKQLQEAEDIFSQYYKIEKVEGMERKTNF